MTNFAILTDSCSDLTAPLRERFGVDGYVPGALVYPDGSNHYADLDWKNMTPAQFFGTMMDINGVCHIVFCVSLGADRPAGRC